MAINTTAFGISTTPLEIISSGTTWANTNGSHLYDTTPLLLFCDSPIRVWIAGSSALTSATGFPILSSGYFEADMYVSERLFAVTTNSTATLRGLAGRQNL